MKQLNPAGELRRTFVWYYKDGNQRSFIREEIVWINDKGWWKPK